MIEGFGFKSVYWYLVGPYLKLFDLTKSNFLCTLTGSLLGNWLLNTSMLVFLVVILKNHTHVCK